MAFIILTVTILSVLLYSLEATGQYNNVTVEVDTTRTVAVVDEMFVGVTIDIGNLPVALHFRGLNFSSERVRLLASGLSPSYLRIGGTAGDGLTFNPTGENITDGNHTFTGATWDTINQFTEDVGWQLIFGLNALQRKDGQWDPSNAIQLLNYTVDMKYHMAGWELGNEPDIFPKMLNKSVSGAQLGRDFQTLKSVLARYPQFQSAMILGPDVSTLSRNKDPYYTDFLQGGGSSVVDRITIHHYYENGETAKLEDFTNLELMDSLAIAIETAQNLSRPTNPTTPIWLGETSSCYNGGAPGLSDTYLAGFLWLDKLAMAAKMGLKAVLRQQFFGLNYPLIDDQTFDPKPDYWLTYLYKRLSGNAAILSAKSSTPGVRVYAHCIGMYNPFGYMRGTVVLSVLVPGEESVRLSVPQFKGQPVDVFWLEPVGNITSQRVSLNGIPLELSGNRFPEIHPLSLQEDTIYLPGKTFGFLAFPMADVKVCQS